MSNEIEQALSVLTWKEIEVFLAYAEFCSNGEYLPREISQALQDKLDLAPSTLRVYILEIKDVIVSEGAF
jgi:hypothetical protein